MKKILDIFDIYVYEDDTILEFPSSKWDDYSDIILDKRKRDIQPIFLGNKIIYEDGSEWTPPFFRIYTNHQQGQNRIFSDIRRRT